jgi:hypothetical protein
MALSCPLASGNIGGFVLRDYTTESLRGVVEEVFFLLFDVDPSSVDKNHAIIADSLDPTLKKAWNEWSTPFREDIKLFGKTFLLHIEPLLRFTDGKASATAFASVKILFPNLFGEGTGETEFLDETENESSGTFGVILSITFERIPGASDPDRHVISGLSLIFPDDDWCCVRLAPQGIVETNLAPKVAEIASPQP